MPPPPPRSLSRCGCPPLLFCQRCPRRLCPLPSAPPPPSPLPSVPPRSPPPSQPPPSPLPSPPATALAAALAATARHCPRRRPRRRPRPQLPHRHLHHPPHHRRAPSSRCVSRRTATASHRRGGRRRSRRCAMTSSRVRRTSCTPVPLHACQPPLHLSSHTAPGYAPPRAPCSALPRGRRLHR